MSDPDFYVGYLPKAPPGLGRWTAVTAAALTASAVCAALILVWVQRPFAPSFFEFQKYRDFAGIVEEFPYPSLLVRTDGPFLSRRLLVAPGKNGASEMVRSLDRRPVRLKGSLIYRQDDVMIEVVPGSISEGSVPPGMLDEPLNLGHVALKGEIADSKCYLGVMNPGSGKVHRDCAVRCISGGIPPSFLVRDSRGDVRALLLTGPAGHPLRNEVLDFVAEPVEISGELLRSANTLVLRADSLAFRRIHSGE
jgi:hypothetical protein